MSSVSQSAASFDLGTLVPREPPQAIGLAVYVLGAQDGERFPLPKAGSITIGRDAGCEIVLVHPMISRRHATLHVGTSLVLEDLRSANGTTLGKQRLEPGERRELEVDQPFTVGSLTLVVHQHRMPTLTSARVFTPTQLLEQIDRRRKSFGLARITMARAVEARWMEAILAPSLRAGDLIVPLREREAAVFRPDVTEVEAKQLLHACLADMSRWQVPCHGDSFQADDSTASAADAARRFLFGTQTLLTQRGSIVVGDAAMSEVHRVIDRVASTTVNVLILGETGAGKDVVASLIHERSTRASKPLLRINCATLSESLLETELFGHEKGAFTGAAGAKPGLLESADGGTVFLDELGEMPPSVQAKLLRVVETREITRVGGLKSRLVDVRFIAASNRDLEHEVEEGTFRRDLFYRLNGVQIRVPPLRERTSEIVPLALHFLNAAARSFGVSRIAFSPAALDALKAYSWPGSIRQLRNVVERSVLLGNGPVLEPEDLGLPPAAVPSGSPAIDTATVAKAPAATPADGDDDERQRIVDALNACSGNQSRAAALLGMPRRTLVRKLGRYRVPRPRGPSTGMT